jgi:hypothetical protein
VIGPGPLPQPDLAAINAKITAQLDARLGRTAAELSGLGLPPPALGEAAAALGPYLVAVAAGGGGADPVTKLWEQWVTGAWKAVGGV